MSGRDDQNGNDERSQGGQPEGGQPQGGQPEGGQPQGGQPQGGQPRGGQPQGGQPQGGQPRGGQGPPGQPQGGQPQGGQAPRGQPVGGQPQGGQRRGRGMHQQSAIDKLQQPEPMGYLKGIAGSFVLAGVLLGVMSFIVGRVGGFAILPQSVATARDMMSGAQTNPVSEGISTTHSTLLTYLPAEIAPFIAFTLAIGFAVLVATRLRADANTRMLTAAVGNAVGSFLFVALGTLIVAVTAPSVPESLSDGGFGSGFGGGSMATSMGLGSPQIGPLVINSVLVAVFAAIVSVAVVYAVDNLFPQSASN